MRIGLLVAAGAIVATVAPAPAETPRPEAADQTLGMALMSAVVQSDGTLVRGAGVVSSVRSAQGWYTIRFSRDVTDCAGVASLGDARFNISYPGSAAVNPDETDVTGVSVLTYSAAGNFTDLPFKLIVFCAR